WQPHTTSAAMIDDSPRQRFAPMTHLPLVRVSSAPPARSGVHSVMQPARHERRRTFPVRPGIGPRKSGRTLAMRWEPVKPNKRATIACVGGGLSSRSASLGGRGIILKLAIQSHYSDEVSPRQNDGTRFAISYRRRSHLSGASMVVVARGVANETRVALD